MGAAIAKTIVRKNLILRLAVPRFFVQGDEVMISALVHNYLANAKTARVSLDVERPGRAGRRHAATSTFPAAARCKRGLAGARAAGAQRHDHRQGAHRRRIRRAGTGTAGQHSRREARQCARRIAGCRRQRRRSTSPSPTKVQPGSRVARASASRLPSPARSSARWITSPRSRTAAWSRPCRASCRISWSRRRCTISD